MQDHNEFDQTILGDVRYCDILRLNSAPHSARFWCVSVGQICRCCGTDTRIPKSLISFDLVQPIRPRYINARDGQTGDDQL